MPLPASLPIALHAEVLRGPSHFDSLQAPWQAAIERMPRPSLFVTPTFLRLAWQHLAEEGDEPWFVVVRQGGELVGLLPLVRRRERSSRVFRHVLSHMGLFGGDRPGLVHTVPADAVWQAALAALRTERRRWQALDLRELEADAWPVRHAASFGAPVRLEPCTEAGALPIEGTWDDYLERRSRNTRQGFKRHERRLFEAHPHARIDIADSAATVDAALDRYFALDAKSWKRDAGVEFWRDPRQGAALRDIVRTLAATGQASVWLLADGSNDMAGLVRLRQGRITYERCATYDPAYARFAPSTYLCMQAVRALFGTQAEESDVMGLPGPLSDRPALHAWYPVVRPTWRLVVLNAPWWWRAVQRLRGRDDVPLPSPSPALEQVTQQLLEGLELPPAASLPQPPRAPVTTSREERTAVKADTQSID